MTRSRKTVTNGICGGVVIGSDSAGSVTNRLMIPVRGRSEARPTKPANSDMPQMAAESRWGGRFARRSSAVARGQPAPPRYCQYNQRYNDVGRIAHGTL